MRPGVDGLGRQLLELVGGRLGEALKVELVAATFGLTSPINSKCLIGGKSCIPCDGIVIVGQHDGLKIIRVVRSGFDPACAGVIRRDHESQIPGAGVLQRDVDGVCRASIRKRIVTGRAIGVQPAVNHRRTAGQRIDANDIFAWSRVHDSCREADGHIVVFH